MQPSPYVQTPGDGVAEFQEAYLWVLICGTLSAMLMAYGIGANDVANTFATSVGARSLTFHQAVILATICETLGAAFLGAEVAKTVRKGIVELEYFKWTPEMLMVGMTCALLTAGIWLILCSSWGLPVSTTHSIIGAILGIGIAVNPSTVQWLSVGRVVLSWVVSPCLSGLLAALFFGIFRKFIMRVKNGHQRAFFSYPILLCLLVLSVVLSFTFKIPFSSLRKQVEKSPSVAAAVAVAVSIGITILSFAATYKWVKRKIEFAPDTLDTLKASGADSGILTGKSDASITLTSDNENAEDLKRSVHDDIESDETLRELHESAEKFPPKTEEVYNYLVVVAACFSSIGHGANDVANAIGPLAAIWAVYREAQLSNEVHMSWWFSLGGGITISIGLLTYGYKVLSTMSVKLCNITPSRGFSIELGSAWVIIVGSYFGIPLSTTHCKVGATIGVGLCESPEPWKFKGVNISLFGKVVVGWVTTLFFTAGLSVFLFTIVSVAIFPRMERYPCPFMNHSTQFHNKGLIDYSNATVLNVTLMEKFDDWDANSNKELDVDEIAAKFSSNTTQAGKILSIWAEDFPMTLADWMSWRCGKGLDTSDRPCNPLCKTETYTSTARCRLSKRSDEYGYALMADYEVTQCEFISRAS